MSTYNLWLKQHLAWYKASRLGVKEAGVWKRNGKAYQHILPEHLQQLNILETYRYEFWLHKEQHTTINLHNDFHHLNSSQAMCFNLFYPFIHDLHTQQIILAKIFGLPQEPVEIHTFETIIDMREGTNFDFFVQLQSKTRLFFELKLSESGFGSASDNKKHREKLNTMYIPRLAGNISARLFESQWFFQYYQLLRNISYINPENQDILFFIVPEQNRRLAEEIFKVLDLVSPELQPRIRVIFLEQLIKRLLQEDSCLDARNSTHYLLFKEKYIEKIP